MPAPHHTDPRRWQPLTDQEWAAIQPYILQHSIAWTGAGRPIKDLRARVNGIFWIAASGSAWKTLPKAYGKPDTVSRHFRRLTANHLWQRLLHALADPKAPEALKSLEHWICRACRRAVRRAGLSLITTARRLGFYSALKAPGFLLPNEDLSEVYRGATQRALAIVAADFRRAPRGLLALCGRLLAFAGGRKRIPRCLEPV